MIRHLLLASALLTATACRPTTRLVVPPSPTGTATGGSTSAPTAMTDALRIADRYRVAAITSRRIDHADYWSALQPSLVSRRLRVEEIGRSLYGRQLRAITFGTGPVSVLLWSQMHGDEATATMALADILAWMTAPGNDAMRDRIATAVTVTMVPMLNPDGAERFQRENAVGIDINRDARRLSTPEGRALKALRDKLNPNFGFNLHDQNARTLVGRAGLQAGIALLAPATDAERTWNDVRSRARLVAAGIARDLGTEIPGRVAKYDDSFNPRAFGDLMQAWGTSTVLIESGALPNDPDKQQLRRLNAAAIIRALDAIATKSYESADPNIYEQLPYNTGGAYDVLVRGGQIVLPNQPPLVADVALNYDDAVARTGPRVREVGDLTAVVAIDTIDATGLFLHPRAEALTTGDAPGYLTIGARGAFDIRAGADPQSTIRRRIE
jgi:hypothetical protein